MVLHEKAVELGEVRTSEVRHGLESGEEGTVGDLLEVALTDVLRNTAKHRQGLTLNGVYGFKKMWVLGGCPKIFYYFLIYKCHSFWQTHH